ncbi:hypothetical protein PUF88_04805 [Lactobacillaceae bacterium L1_55_11]|nr:hypothetical protein [Lactobacillaceae bacterium L1_55_11]
MQVILSGIQFGFLVWVLITSFYRGRQQWLRLGGRQAQIYIILALVFIVVDLVLRLSSTIIIDALLVIFLSFTGLPGAARQKFLPYLPWFFVLTGLATLAYSIWIVPGNISQYVTPIFMVLAGFYIWFRQRQG